MRAFLVTSNGDLRGYNLNAGTELGWSPVSVTQVAEHYYNYVTVLPSLGLVVVFEFPSNRILGYDSSSGTLQWTLDVPQGLGSYAVLEDDVLMIEASGALTPVFCTNSSATLGMPLLTTTNQTLPWGYWVDGRLIVTTPTEIICYEPTCAYSTYCSAKMSSFGCAPEIDWNGFASFSGPDDFHVEAQDILGQSTGYLLWGLPANPPPPFGGPKTGFGSSFWGTNLCVTGPRRAGMLSSGGTAGTCDGKLRFHFTQAMMNANGLTLGSKVYAQFVYADPAHPDGSGLGHTNALEFQICP